MLSEKVICLFQEVLGDFDPKKNSGMPIVTQEDRAEKCR